MEGNKEDTLPPNVKWIQDHYARKRREFEKNAREEEDTEEEDNEFITFVNNYRKNNDKILFSKNVVPKLEDIRVRGATNIREQVEKLSHVRPAEEREVQFPTGKTQDAKKDVKYYDIPEIPQFNPSLDVGFEKMKGRYEERGKEKKEISKIENLKKQQKACYKKCDEKYEPKLRLKGNLKATSKGKTKKRKRKKTKKKKKSLKQSIIDFFKN